MTWDVDALHGLLAGCVTPTGRRIVRVDVGFEQVPVNLDNAEAARPRLVALLDAYPDQAWGQPLHPLRAGPSYIEVGAAVDDQGTALRLFAVGAALGLWKVITPATIGITGEEAEAFMGAGFVTISGYNPNGRPTERT